MSTSKTLRIIDTNVIIEPGKIPDRLSGKGEAECAEQCARFLREFIRNPASGIVLDREFEILNEYKRVVERVYGKIGLQAGLTGEFLKFAFTYMAKPPYEDLIDLQKTGENEYAVFPDDPALDGFDPPDKKFIAAACVHPEHPPVVEGTDCKGLKYRDALAKHGVNIEFLCPAYIKANYRHKFPGEEPPEL